MDESQETLLKFPCQFPIKIMGKMQENFDITVIEIIRKHVPDMQDFSIKTRKSRHARYISLTVMINATSKTQLDNIYLDLCTHEKVILAL